MAGRTPRRPPASVQDTPRNGRVPPAGYLARALAVRLVSAVIDRGRALDDAIADSYSAAPFSDLAQRDRGLARLIAATTLRRRGELSVVVASFIERPLPKDRGLVDHILTAAAAQLIVLDLPPHAVINVAVEQCRHDRGARRFDRLANAVLRRVSERGREALAGAGGLSRNIPGWLWSRWVATYGKDVALAIAEASLVEPALDITARSDAAGWAARLGGTVLPTGSIRVAAEGRIEDLAGFAEGQWWVQDAAAALPARLLGDVAGLRIADLCAAPGGKAAQLAAAGARVTAVDQSSERLARLAANMRRLDLSVDAIVADATAWQPAQPFDAVLVDAPCTATGTIRRHPDILYLKRPGDIARLSALQQRLLANAISLVRPGGTVVYCSCSLEPEEGVGVVEAVLAGRSDATRVPIRAAEVGGSEEWITAAGDLRTLPFHMPLAPPAVAGIDGFFAARLRRS